MSAITTVIFDMFNTIAQDGTDLWRQTFEAIIEEQRLETTPEELRHAWDYGAGNFRDRRTAPGAPFSPTWTGGPTPSQRRSTS